MKRINFFLSSEFEPWFNLAVEDWIFSQMDPSIPTLFLWRNSDTVVIGRYQNPWVECDLRGMEENNVYLARRQSGGGAVYHDLNNTNFTFMAGSDDYSPQLGFSIILKALEEFNLKAHVSGRNDIIVNVKGEERKFSGSAFRKLSDRAFHHGTLLINSDMTKLSKYLTPSEKKLAAKGVKSVRSRVVNLSELNEDITHDSLCGEIKKYFFSHFDCQVEPVILNRETMEIKQGFSDIYENLKSSDWLYGKTPPFTHRLEERLSMGMIEIYFNVKKGIIEECTIHSDSLYSDLVSALMKNFRGIPYDRDSVKIIINKLIDEFPDKKELLKDVSQFIIGELE